MIKAVEAGQYRADNYGGAVHIISSTWVNGELFWLMQGGNTTSLKNAFTPYNKNKLDLYALRTEEVQADYPHVFDVRGFVKGDLLLSGKGVVFIYESDTRVWSGRIGTWSDTIRMSYDTLEAREEQHGKLSKPKDLLATDEPLGTFQFNATS